MKQAFDLICHQFAHFYMQHFRPRYQLWPLDVCGLVICMLFGVSVCHTCLVLLQFYVSCRIVVDQWVGEFNWLMVYFCKAHNSIIVLCYMVY